MKATRVNCALRFHASLPVSPRQQVLEAVALAGRFPQVELELLGRDAGLRDPRLAHQTVFVSYAVYRVRTLGDALLHAVNRGVALTLVLEPSDFEESDSVAKAMGALHPQLADKTEVLVWPADKRVRDEHGHAGVLHAKCAVADGKMLFLSSANLTEPALTVNMELGALIRGGPLPGRVEEHFERLRTGAWLRSR